MQSHLLNLVLFAGLVSLVFSFLLRDEARGRWRFFGVAFATFVLSSFAAAWLMRWFPS